MFHFAFKLLPEMGAIAAQFEVNSDPIDENCNKEHSHFRQQLERKMKHQQTYN